MKLFESIFSDPKRSRWFVVLVCFVLGLLAGWLIGETCLEQ